MCEAASIISATTLVISMASAAASYQGQQQQAKSTYNYQKQSVESANEIAAADYRNRTAAQQTQLMQIGEQGAQKKLQNNIEAAQVIGAARSANGATNTAGTSVDALYADYDRQNAMFNTSVDNNTHNASQQYALDATGTQGSVRQYQSNFNFAPGRGGDAIGAALQIGQGGLTAYDRYLKNQPEKTKTSEAAPKEPAAAPKPSPTPKKAS